MVQAVFVYLVLGDIRQPVIITSLLGIHIGVSLLL